jgi:hypothetical protein
MMTLISRTKWQVARRRRIPKQQVPSEIHRRGGYGMEELDIEKYNRSIIMMDGRDEEINTTNLRADAAAVEVAKVEAP